MQQTRQTTEKRVTHSSFKMVKLPMESGRLETLVPARILHSAQAMSQTCHECRQRTEAERGKARPAFRRGTGQKMASCCSRGFPPMLHPRKVHLLTTTPVWPPPNEAARTHRTVNFANEPNESGSDSSLLHPSSLLNPRQSILQSARSSRSARRPPQRCMRMKARTALPGCAASRTTMAAIQTWHIHSDRCKRD